MSQRIVSIAASLHLSLHAHPHGYLIDKIFLHFRKFKFDIKAKLLVYLIHSNNETFIVLFYKKSAYQWQSLKKCKAFFIILDFEMNHFMSNNVS